MYLSGFNYEVRYRSRTQNANADWLSRLPTQNEAPDASTDEDVSLVLAVGVLPVTSEQIKGEMNIKIIGLIRQLF